MVTARVVGSEAEAHAVGPVTHEPEGKPVVIRPGLATCRNRSTGTPGSSGPISDAPRELATRWPDRNWESGDPR